MVKNLLANPQNLRDTGSVPGLGRCPGEGHGNPFQYSCLENSVDRGTWWTTVLGVTKSRTQLSGFHIPLPPSIPSGWYKMAFSEKLAFLRANSSTKIQVRQRLLVVAQRSRDLLTFLPSGWQEMQTRSHPLCRLIRLQGGGQECMEHSNGRS